MRDLEFEEIEITRDLTIGKAGVIESFYTKLGANVDPSNGHEIVKTESAIKHANFLKQVQVITAQ